MSTQPTQPTHLYEVLSPANFNDWLLNHDPEDEVGLGASTRDCPIARYLRDSGFTDVHVGFRRVTVDGETFVPHPWVSRFVGSAANLGPVPIKEWQARQILIEAILLPYERPENLDR